MRFTIQPYTGAGRIQFGMTSDQVQNVLCADAKKFKKVKEATMYTDAFRWCHVYYKDSGKCEAIEFFEPAEVIFNGETIIGKPYNQVKNAFEIIDNNIEINDVGFTSFQFGIGVYAPFSLKEPNEPVEGVIVFEKGYYD